MLDRPNDQSVKLKAVDGLRRALLDKGYQPVEIVNGTKACKRDAWPATIGLPPLHKGALGTGIVTNGLRAIDVDIDDPDLADRVISIVEEVAGATPLMRTRANSSRRAIIFRAPDGETPPKRIIKIGTTAKVEILGAGQQLFAYGIHPSGVELEWPLSGPDAVARNDLPMLSTEAETELEKRLASIANTPVGSGAVSRGTANLPQYLASTEASGAAHVAAREQAYAKKALDDESEKVASAGVGARNNQLNMAAFSLGQLVASGWVALPEVVRRLTDAALAAGLDASEARATILSGIKAGRASPRPSLADRNRSGASPAVVINLPSAARIVERDGVRFDADTGEVVGDAPAATVPPFAAEPFIWTDPAAIPPRAWLYGKHYTRGFVSSTVAPGGVGKSALTMCEAMAIATGRDLLGVEPAECVPVWLLNLEDPMDELYRRAMAITKRYGLTQRDLDGRLFLNSGRVTKLTIATATKSGTVIVRPVIEAIVTEVQRFGIGLIVIDPFVASHAVPENDNPAINAVVTAWREIAERTGCAVELVHHTRKTLGGPITTQDGRGGNALEGGVRSMRALNRMTEDEGARAGVENHRSFFRIDDADGKANMSPPSRSAAWYELRSVDLGNATSDRPSDHVGVVARWHWPDPLADVTADHLRRVQGALTSGGYRKDVQATDWAGHVVGDILGIDTGRGIRGKDNVNAQHRAARSKVSGLLSIWTKSGALCIEHDKDADGNQRPFIRVGEPCAE